MNIVIVGVGGVGGYFGGKIAKYFEDDNENNIYFVARGEHLNKIREDGLELRTKKEGKIICRPTMITDRFDELPMMDICFICVKAYDLNNVLDNIQDKIKEDTEIIPLLNGVDIGERIRKVIKKGIVYPACVYVGTHIESPGIIIQNGGSCTIKFGKEKVSDDSDGQRVINILNKADINCDWTSKNYEEIWSKYMFIAAYGLVTACYNKTLGEVLDNEELSGTVLSIMEVIKSLASKCCLNLPEDIVRASYDKGKSFPYESKTSFQRDYEKNIGRDEREIFGKAIIEMSKKYNLDCECVKKVYGELH